MTEIVSSPTKLIREWANAIHDEWLTNMTDLNSEQKLEYWNGLVQGLRTSQTYPETNAVFKMPNEPSISEITANYNSSIRFRFFVLDKDQAKMSYSDENYNSDYLKENKPQIVIWKAWVKKVVSMIQELNPNIGLGTDDYYLNIGVSSVGEMYELISVLINATVSSEALSEALQSTNALIKNREDAEARDAKRQQGDNGLSAKINANRSKPVNAEEIEQQIQKWQGEIQNMLVARTWGWEIEAPNPGENVTVPAGVERGSDGSVESYEDSHDDCQCGCNECTYHDCDCDDCESRNDDPQHCGYDDCSSCCSYEYRTTGGIPRALHPGMRKLLEQIADTEKNETAGTHIHVYARDLEAYQIGVVLGGYALTQRVWDVIAGRDVENDQRCKTYANLVPGEAVSHTLRHKALYSVGKFNAVNTLHVTTDRGTLEFRQMNCNFDFERITLMAWMVRGLVEVAKRGATITEFFNITDIEGFIKLYAKYGFTTFNETEAIEDPMGSRYNQSRNRIAVA